MATISISMKLLEDKFDGLLSNYCREMLKEIGSNYRVNVYRDGVLAIYAENLGECAKYTVRGEKFEKYQYRKRNKRALEAAQKPTGAFLAHTRYPTT